MDVTLALQRAVKGYSKGTDVLAAEMRLPRTSLLHKVDPNYHTQHCSPEEALEIMQRTGDVGALHAMAAELGLLVLPLPHVGGTDGESAMALAASVREFGEFAAQTAAGLGDGRINDNELKRIEREGGEALAAIHKLIEHAQALNLQAKPAPLRKVV